MPIKQGRVNVLETYRFREQGLDWTNSNHLIALGQELEEASEEQEAISYHPAELTRTLVTWIMELFLSQTNIRARHLPFLRYQLQNINLHQATNFRVQASLYCSLLKNTARRWMTPTISFRIDKNKSFPRATVDRKTLLAEQLWAF